MIDWIGTVVARGRRTLVDGVTLGIGSGELVVLAGPNGAGKSTLVRAMTGEWPLAGGRVRVLGRDLAQWPRRELATRFGVLPQKSALAFDFRVEEVVALGRLPHRAGEGGASDTEVVAASLVDVGLADFGRRSYLDLSAGEQQRVHVARVLAQLWEAGSAGLGGAMLLDEPTSALDLGQQQRLLDLLWRWSRRGVAVGVVLHDLNLAARYADRLALLAGGRLVAAGSPAEVLEASLLARVYDCDVVVRTDAADGRPLVTLAGPTRMRPVGR
jgi:iron complex transport system ATP-binding protein